jgi:hypothetical protein
MVLLGAAIIIAFAAPSPSAPAVACEAFSDQPLTVNSLDNLPPEVLSDARMAADSLYPGETAKAEAVLHQLAATYLAAREVDVVVYFNPGGLGWDPMAEIPGWESISNGIRDTLQQNGLEVLVITYKRTVHGLAGPISEMEAMMGFYSLKTGELTAGVEFLTRHLPHLKVILTGESQGAAVCEQVVQTLRDNSDVFSIQTGPPFWHASHAFERSLVIAHNGTYPDAFSSGNWIVIARANLEAMFGIYTGSSGNILLYIGAPGHDYSWEYESVRREIMDFLKFHFVSPLN